MPAKAWIMTAPPRQGRQGKAMDDIERAIHDFIADVLLEGEDISFDERTPLLEHRLIDSLNVEELIAFAESTYSITLSDWPHSKWETIQNMAGLIRAHSPTISGGRHA
ncbi:acyl carrier protein [Micromonospora fulviviridis]|uniref:acyl carrier protein n=1 Tax=Micromonospora fulviviridis TaxID=47860 RepID=UPI00379E10A5